MRVIFHYVAGEQLQTRIAALAAKGLDVRIVAPDDEAGFAAALPECDVLWHVLKPVRRSHMEAAPRLKLIQKMGAGVDTIDLAAARERGIAVCNLPGTNSAAVAEHALALMLAVLRKVAVFDRETRAGEGWSWPLSRQGELGEIGGRTVGLVGYGATASRLAPILAAMGARVLYSCRTPRPGAVGRQAPLDELIASSDIISLHLPLGDATRGLIGRDQLARMKPGAILINTARGGLVDQPALVEALQSGRLAGAGLDVFAVEPAEADNPLLELGNVVATPHIAWLTIETFERSLGLMAENCLRLEAGSELLHRVA